jgi:NADH:ubiquinone oxidoreductase subunit C
VNNDIEIKTTKNNLRALLYFLKKNTMSRYEQLIDIAVTDVLGKINRFSVNYLLKSLLYSSRLIVVVKTNEVVPIPSVMDIFKSSN